MKTSSFRVCTALLALAVLLVPTASIAQAPVPHQSWTYTYNADFDKGELNNVVHSIPDQLQLDDTTKAFPFIWVALSTDGTVVKIDTATGEIKGKYSTTSDSDKAHNPSRTTVASDGSVWAGNRAQSSVIHIGNLEAGGCVDRNNDGKITTSTGYKELDWPGGTNGQSSPVSQAEDECILHQIHTPGGDARHVSVDADGNVWVGSHDAHIFQLLDGRTAAVLREVRFNCGGYGGLVNKDGVLWSADNGQKSVLRWDPKTPVSTAQCFRREGAYGLAADSQGNVWLSSWGPGVVYRFGADGSDRGTFAVGHPDAQGIAVDRNDHVWVSSSHSTANPNQISHLLPNGTLVGLVTGAGVGSTGVSVDAAGKIWITNRISSDATRIDPTQGPIGADGVTRVGAFDLTVPLPGGEPYNYSDMTGNTLIGKPNAGTWTVVHDSGIDGAAWGTLTWTADVPDGGGLTFTVATSNDGVNFGPAVPAAKGAELDVQDGRYVRITAAFTRAPSDASPILYDVTLEIANNLPDCSEAAPSRGLIWPPNHKFVPITVQGVSDLDNDPLTVTVTGIRQDEPVQTQGDGNFEPDGRGVGTSTAQVRAERTGNPGIPGDGRFYHIAFTADDGHGGTCTGTVKVAVPHDRNKTPVDQGPLYDSTKNG